MLSERHLLYDKKECKWVIVWLCFYNSSKFERLHFAPQRVAQCYDLPQQMHPSICPHTIYIVFTNLQLHSCVLKTEQIFPLCICSGHEPPSHSFHTRTVLPEAGRWSLEFSCSESSCFASGTLVILSQCMLAIMTV